MFNSAHFSRMPSSKKPHTKFKMPSVIAGSSLHGDIVPIDCYLAAPGDIDRTRLNGNIRMSTPIAPLMSQIKGSVNSFFVPLRLVWEHTKEFFGENTTSSGYQETEYKIPGMVINSPTGDQVVVGSVSHYLGKPLYRSDNVSTVEKTVSILKERAYWLVYSEYYRHQQIQNPVLLTTDDSSGIGSLDGVQLTIGSSCAKCLKDFDYFTTCTRAPEYGPEVSIPLGSVAPIITDTSLHDMGNALIFGNERGTSQGVGHTLATDDGGFVYEKDQFEVEQYSDQAVISKSNLVADLASATGSSIDELFLAMAAQAWYHNANFGSRYFEALEIHYGVSNPDLVMFRPEHIGEFKFDISVQEVLSTAGATSDSDTKLGQPGAKSQTFISRSLYNKSFGEWGFVITLFNTYHQRYYQAGVMREDLYEDMFDFYFPEFANIGDQSVDSGELFYGDGNEEDAFGYQEAWAEMRYRPSRLTGILDPYAEADINSDQNALSYWVLAEKFASRPTLSKSFMIENRDAIANALVTGENGPDYIWNFYFDRVVMRELPLYSVPGLPGRGRGII